MHQRSPNSRQFTEMFAQLLLVALALVAIANGATCSCSGCKGITAKDCSVRASDRLRCIHGQILFRSRRTSAPAPPSARRAPAPSAALYDVACNFIYLSEALQGSKVSCAKSFGCDAGCKSFGCSKSACK